MRQSLLALAAALLQLCSAAFVQLPASRRWASAHRSHPSPASRSTTSLTLRADLGIEDSSLAPIVAPAAASAPHWLQKPVAVACVGLLLVFLAPSSAHATTFADSSFVQAQAGTVSSPNTSEQLSGTTATSPLLAAASSHSPTYACRPTQAGSLIFVSEIGDKTFFIATLLAARASRLLTFAGAIVATHPHAFTSPFARCHPAAPNDPSGFCAGCAGALAFMTIVSVAIGQERACGLCFSHSPPGHVGAFSHTTRTSPSLSERPR